MDILNLTFSFTGPFRISIGDFIGLGHISLAGPMILISNMLIVLLYLHTADYIQHTNRTAISETDPFYSKSGPFVYLKRRES